MEKQALEKFQYDREELPKSKFIEPKETHQLLS